MKDKDFDSIDKLAKEVLQDFEANLDPLDWLEMEQQLNAETAIDQMAKTALEDYEPSFSEADWLQFEQHRKRKKQPIPLVPWIKTAEMGMVSLFIFTLINFFPQNDSHKYEQTPTQQPNTQQESPVVASNALPVLSKQQADEYFNTEASANKKAATSTALLSNTQKKSTVSSTVDKAFNQKNRSATTAEISVKSSENVSVPTSRQEIASNSVAISNPTNLAVSFDQNNKQPLNTSTNQNQSVVEGPSAAQKIALKNKALKLLLPIHIQPLSLNTEPITKLEPIQLKKSIYKKVYLGGLTSLAANFENDLGGSSVGYGAGLSFDIEFGSKFGLKTALIASSKRYSLSENYEVASNSNDNIVYSVASTVRTHLVVIEVPLDVQFTFFRSDKWKIYATAGVKGNLISSRTYSGNEKTSLNGLTLTKDIQNNQFNRGLMEGGSLNQNVFLSVGGGIGLERQLGDRVSIYLHPVYRHALTAVDGIRIHSFNFNIGIRTSL